MNIVIKESFFSNQTLQIKGLYSVCLSKVIIRKKGRGFREISPLVLWHIHIPA